MASGTFQVGRPGVEVRPKQIKQAATGITSKASINKKQLASRLKKVESKLSALSGEIADLNNEIAAIRADINR